MTLTKGDLIWMTTYKTHYPHERTEEIIEAFIECLKIGLAAGEDVSLRGFGRFTVSKRKPHVRYNPTTKRFANIPERRSISFRAGQVTKERMNHGRKS